VVDTHQELAARNRVSLRPVLAKRLLPGDPLLLERLVGNLVANAIKYNEPGGWVEVEVTSGSGPALTVRNTGQAVPAEAMPALFEPFRRRTADRTDQGGGVHAALPLTFAPAGSLAVLSGHCPASFTRRAGRRGEQEADGVVAGETREVCLSS
jgi:K+-sensing histidine kinase KdpD